MTLLSTDRRPLANPMNSNKIRFNIIYDYALFSVIHIIGKVKWRQRIRPGVLRSQKSWAILNNCFKLCRQLLPRCPGQLHYIIVEARPQFVARAVRPTQQGKKKNQ